MTTVVRKSIRQQVIDLGEERWRDEGRRGWEGCPLVNPLCPDDLCVLPLGHVGTEQGYHLLGTDAYDDPLKLTKRSVLYLEGPLPKEKLVKLGWKRQKELFRDPV